MFSTWIETHLRKAKPTGGSGQYIACCDYHGDENPSMLVDPETGHFCCQACSESGWLDQYAKDHLLPAPPSKRNNVPAHKEPKRQKEHKQWPPPEWGPVVASYYYRNAQGENHIKVDRHESKDFPLYRWENGKWRAGMTYKAGPLKGQKVERYCYHYDKICQADVQRPIIWCEGEKDADLANSLGALATTTIGGSGSSGRLADWDVFRGRSVTFIPDNDDAGEKYLAKNAAKLLEHGADVLVCRLPGLQEGGDLSDWMAEGHTKEQLAELLDQAERYQPPAEKTEAPKKPDGKRSIASFVEPLKGISKNYDAQELQSALEAIRADLEGVNDAPTTMVLAEIKRVLKAAGIQGSLKDFSEIARPKKAATDASSGTIALEATPPWHEEVSGSEVLTELESVLDDYLVMPDGAIQAISLWLAHTFLIKVLWLSPRLYLKSPVKRCGKTTALTVISALAEKPLSASSATEASLFRSMERFKPTLFLDEADATLMRKDNDGLRGVLNAGFVRGAPVLRCSGDDHEVKAFDVFGAVGLAGIGNLWETLEDRCVVIPMQRKGKGQQTKRLKLRELHQRAHVLKKKLARWCSDIEDQISEADPEVPQLSSDRAEDLWRVLIAIADAAGGDWPERARSAAIALSGESGDKEEEIGVILLHDIKEIFEARDCDRIRTETLLDELTRLTERPWPEWRKGKPISPRSIARLLRPFGVSSRTIRFPVGGPQKGYLKSDFENSFSRYISPEDPDSTDLSVTSVTTASLRHLAPTSDPLQRPMCNGSETASNPRGCGNVTHVTDKSPEITKTPPSNTSEDPETANLSDFLGRVL